MAGRELHPGEFVAGGVTPSDRHLRGEPPAEPRPLTCRQREVFRCLARGLSYQEAADELGVSLWDIKKHVSNGLRRRKVLSREEVYAAEGWLRVNGDAA
jgi:DNA-binding NarL/FixJ family response regulator